MFTAITNLIEIVNMFLICRHVLLIFKCITVNFHILYTEIKWTKICVYKINVVFYFFKKTFTIGTDRKIKLINKMGIVLL